MTNDRITSEITDARLNDLYWSSGYTIDEILSEIGIGRNTLYSSIDPLPAGSSCPGCGDELVFTNRTHRAAGTSVCLVCGVERQVANDSRPSDSATAAERSATESGNGVDRWNRWRDELGSVAPERAALIGGAAALGLMLGAAATRAWRH